VLPAPQRPWRRRSQRRLRWPLADRTVTDPKIWCGEAAKTMAGKNAEKLIDSVASAAANLTDRHSLAVVCGERPFPAPKGGFRPSIYFN